MINIIFSGIAYAATLIGCYDGDTCTIRVSDAPPFIAQTKIRFAEFDTPERRGKCEREKRLASDARTITLDYMRRGGDYAEASQADMKTLDVPRS